MDACLCNSSFLQWHDYIYRKLEYRNNCQLLLFSLRKLCEKLTLSSMYVKKS